MAFIVENWYLIVLVLASGALLAWPALSGGAIGGVSCAQAVQLINRDKAQVIDVCEPAEFAAGHVGGAKNVPLSQFGERLPQVAKNKALPLIIVCARGARASRAAAQARRLGYEKAQPLTGGLAAWKNASMPVEKS